MEEKTKIGNQSSVDSKALNKKLNIGIFGNRLLMRSVNVGSNFNNMLCDLARANIEFVWTFCQNVD